MPQGALPGQKVPHTEMPPGAPGQIDWLVGGYDSGWSSTKEKDRPRNGELAWDSLFL